jgi:hypothetical protein
MVEQIIMAHSILVKVFLGFLVVGFAIPFLTAKNPESFKKASFIYTMTFQALATMIAFTGVVALVMGEFGMTLSIVLMLIIWALLMFIEIKKYKLIKVANLKNTETYRLLKSAFMKITAVQVMLVIMMVVLKIMEVKGAISLS